MAENAQGLDAATVKLNEQADWYGTHEKSLSKAVRAVTESKAAKRLETAKTNLTAKLDEASRLLADSDGKVADAATRDELSKAVKARDADKIAAASKKVNDSVTAKRRRTRRRSARRGGGRRAGRRTGPDADAAVVFGAATVVHALVFRRFDIEWRRFQQRARLRSGQQGVRMHYRLSSALKRWIDSPLI